MNRSILKKHADGSINKLLGAALGLLIFGIGAARAVPVDAANAAPAGKPIDVAICLDTSNSMDGLIASAKMKLWDIVNELARIKPTPDLRVALYSYGNDGYDPKAGWVRKEADLTTDLDEINKKLFGLTTRGGTEYVARVCRDATEQLKWSDDKNALKIIFVCGNEPASQDREVTLPSVADKAIAKGIVINPIHCGPVAQAKDWQEFAFMAGGKFASIDQDRGTVVIATPMDKPLAELSEKLSTTYVYYGRAGKDKAANQVAQDANARQAGLAAAASRAQSKESGLYRNEDWDLVDRLKRDPKFDVKKIPEAELSDALKKLTPDQREAHVKAIAAKREAMQKQIAELSAKRQEYLKEEMKKNPSKAEKAFDAAVRGTLREQAASKGIKIPE